MYVGMKMNETLNILNLKVIKGFEIFQFSEQCITPTHHHYRIFITYQF